MRGISRPKWLFDSSKRRENINLAVVVHNCARERSIKSALHAAQLFLPGNFIFASLQRLFVVLTYCGEKSSFIH